MTEQPQKSRADSIMGVITALFRIDPLVTLIAVFIIAPIAIPITQAILGGETEVVITFVIFIAGITILVYIPLIIVKAYLQMQKDQTAERTTAVQTESKTRILAEQNKQLRLNELVAAQISVLSTKQDFILGQSQIEDQKVFSETMDQLHELLKNGDVNFVSQITFTETIQKILEDLSGLYAELELAKTSTIDGPPIAIKQEGCNIQSGSIEDIQEQLDNYKTRYENAMLQLENNKADMFQMKEDIALHNKNYLNLQKEFDQYKEKMEPTPTILSKLPEPDGFDQLGEVPKKKDNLIISTIKKAIDKVTPDRSVLEEAVTALDGLTDDTDYPATAITTNDEEEKVFPPEPTTSSFREIQRGIEAPKLAPPSWECPKCKRKNDMKKVRCPRCSTSRAAKAP